MAEPNCEIREGIAYANHGGVELQGDLYLPKGAGPYPAMVNAHGGGWRTGSRAMHRNFGVYMAERGIASFSVSYRLTGKGKPKVFPEAVHDVLAGIRFVRAKAAELRVDPERIGVMGNSAGAHLAALAALASDAPAIKAGEPQGPYSAVSPKVKVLAGTYGVYDMVAQWQHGLWASPRENIVQQFLGVSPMENRQIYFDASPISYATLSNNHIAVYLSWGLEDDLVDPKAHSEAFLTALKQAEFFVRTCVVAGAPHFWMGDPIEEPNSLSGMLAPKLVRFLQEKL